MRTTSRKAWFILVTLSAILLLPQGLFADGASVYKAKCASCHGADGSGDTPMGKKLELRDLRSADVQKQADAKLIEITTKGQGKMPAYEKKLSADEIKQVIAHIRSLAK